MIGIRRVVLAGAACLAAGIAAAQIVPTPDTIPPPPPPPPAAPVAAAAGAPATMTSVSMADLKAAFEAAGLSVQAKTSPNGLMYFEARNNGDLVYGATVLCAGANQSDCKKIVLESGQMQRAVTYEEVNRFNTSGFASRVVTYDTKKKEPSLSLIVDVHGSFDGEMLPGTIRGLLSDMQNFVGQIQGRPTSGFSAASPVETLSPGTFKSAPAGGPVAIQSIPNAN